MKTNKPVGELAVEIRRRLDEHRATVGGLNKEIEQGIESLLSSTNYDQLAERFSRLTDLLRETEDSMRQAAFVTTSKAELLSAPCQRFDGQALSRIGEVDIYV